MNGWIKLHTSLIDWGWFTDASTAHLWVYILLKANWKDKVFLGETIKRGSFATSVANMSNETGLTPKQIRLALSKLEKTGEIVTKRTNRYTVISVIKWDEYQGCADDEGKRGDKQKDKRRETPRSPERATTEDYKTIRHIDNNPPIIPPKEDCSPEFAEALDAFAEMRRRIRKPLTDRAKQMILNKLKKLAIDEETQIEILNQSTMNSWQGVFPLDEQRRRKGMVNVLDL